MKFTYRNPSKSKVVRYKMNQASILSYYKPTGPSDLAKHILYEVLNQVVKSSIPYSSSTDTELTNNSETKRKHTGVKVQQTD